MFKFLKFCRKILICRFAMYLVVYFHFWDKLWSAFLSSKIAEMIFSYITFFPKIIVAANMVYKISGWPLLIFTTTMIILKSIADRGGIKPIPLKPPQKEACRTYVRVIDGSSEEIVPIQCLHQSTLADKTVLAYNDEDHTVTAVIGAKTYKVPSASWLPTRDYSIRVVKNY